MNSDENETPGPETEQDSVNAADPETPESEEPSEAEQLAAENAELKDRLMRTAAEMENVRKRAEREVADAKNYAIASFARDMLTATDNLTRALESLPAEAREQADDSLKALIDGVDMTEREMQRMLQKNGIKPIDAEGHKFDPHRHQAMFEVENPDVPEGTVVQVMQGGFAIGERVLRPALVGVSKGGPKPAKPQAADTGTQADTDAEDGAEAPDPDEIRIDKEA